LGLYKAPILSIITPNGKLVMEPVARVTFGGQGTVELYAWPTLFRVRLLRKPKEPRQHIHNIEDIEWTILTDSGIQWPNSWSKGTFFELAEGLLQA
jgi:hypothetical protein